jgi:CheY-like chemotaxis protein
LITILIVEDDEATARLLKTLLEFEGFSAWAASQTSAAEVLLQDQHPDLVLIDMHLAHAEGLDLLRTVRTDQALAATAVVMTSGMDRRDEALAAGADAFLLKPFDRAELVTTIQRALAKRQF